MFTRFSKKSLRSLAEGPGALLSGKAESLSALLPGQRLGWLREKAGHNVLLKTKKVKEKMLNHQVVSPFHLEA